MLTVNEMGVTVDSRDDENGILECHNDKKVMRFSAQAMDEGLKETEREDPLKPEGLDGARLKKLLRFLLMFMVRGFRFITGSHRIKKSIFFTTYLKTSCVNTGPLSFVPAVRPKSVRL